MRGCPKLMPGAKENASVKTEALIDSFTLEKGYSPLSSFFSSRGNSSFG
jgi:hypothetical protein